MDVRSGAADGAPTVWTVEYRVENDDGAWQSVPVSGLEFAEGEGAYEGLTVVVEFPPTPSCTLGPLQGVIFGGPLPMLWDATIDE